MKDILLKRRTAAIVLIVVALLAVPILGGLKLKAAYNRAFASFETEGKVVDKYGNSLLSDMETCVGAANDVLTIAKSLAGSEDASVRNAEAAIKAYNDADTVIAHYVAYLDVTAKIKLVYEFADGRTDDPALDARYATVLDRSAIIARGYEGAYRDASNKASGLISGFPASLLAKLYDLGNN